MITIEVNNENLDLGKVNITFELLSPVFNQMGSFSYPFTFPATLKNKRLLDFPGRINKHIVAANSFDSTIFLKGIFWKKGKLIVTEIGDETIKAHFTIGEGYFYSLINDLKLSAIDLGGNRDFYDYIGDVNTFPWEKIYDKSYPDNDFVVFPFHIPNFYDDSAKGTFLNETFGGKVNYFTHPNNHYAHSDNTFVLFPFLNYVLTRIFSHLNIFFTKNSFLDDASLKQLTLFNINTERAWHPDDLIYSTVIKRFNLSDYMPDITVSELFGKLENLFKSYVFFDEFNNSIKILFLKDILADFETYSITSKIKTNYIKPNDYDGFEMTYDIDGGDDFADDYFGDISQFNFKGYVANLASLPNTGNEFLDMYYVEDVREYHYYQLNFTGAGGQFVFYASDKDGYSEGNKGLQIEIPGVFPRNGFEPTCGNSGHWQVIDDPWSNSLRPDFRLIFWHGLINNIPFGSPFNLSPAGEVISDYSLEWEGAYGLKEKFYKNVMEFYQKTLEGEFFIHFNPAELKNIDFSRKYRFYNANWLFSKIIFSVTNDSISPAKVTAFKI